MTQTEQTVRQTFAGDGTANPLSIIIPFFVSSDLVVTANLNGVETVKTLGVDYSVSGGQGAGGTVTPLAVIPSGTDWVIYRSLPSTQVIDLTNQGNLLPAAIEEGLDRLVLLLLERTDQTARAVLAADAEINPTGLRMPDLATRAEKLLLWDAAGNIGAVLPTEVLPDSVTMSVFMQIFVQATGADTAKNALGIYVGTLANIGAVTPSANRVYYANDTLEIYLGNGASWDLLSAAAPSNLKPNLVYNGSAQINNRVTCNSGSTFNNNDFSFCLDHVLLLGDGNNAATVVQSAVEKPDGASHSFELISATNNKKFGLLFPLDSLQSASLLSAGNNRKASFSFNYKATAGVQNIRAALMAFTGTVDQLTDPFSDGAWGASGANPTLPGTWTIEAIIGGTVQQIPTTTSWQQYTLEAVEINTASTKNVALVIWVDDTDLVAAADKIYLANIHINEGSMLSPYVRPTFSSEYDACARYFQKSFALTQEPGTNKGLAGALTSYQFSTYEELAGVQVSYRLPMFKSPTVVFYNPSAANALWRNITDNSDEGAATKLHSSDSGFFAQHAAATSVARGDILAIHYTALAEIIP
jgi:hypothetical protein